MTDSTPGQRPSDLTPLLEPRSIAVVGASERPGSFGRNLYINLRDSGFRGVLYPVNPNHRHIETVPAVPAGTPSFGILTNELHGAVIQPGGIVEIE